MSAPYPQQPQEKGDFAAQGAYPPEQPQGYPSQPQEGYPAQPYPVQPQGAYPAQPQGAYPQGTGYDQPPTYQPGAYPQTQYPPAYAQDQQNVVVVTGPPVVGTVERVERRPELGIAALVFAMVTTIFLLSLGCWWSLPCTIVGIVLGITASTTGDSGNLQTAKTHFGISIGCTVFGWVFAVVGLIIIIVSIVAAVANASAEVTNSSRDF